MKKNLSTILSTVSILLSIVSTVLCIVTLSVVLNAENDMSAHIGEQPAAAVVNDSVPAEEFIHETTVLQPVPGDDWHFRMELYNDTDSMLTLLSLSIQDLMNGEPCNEPFLFDGSMLSNLGLDNGGGKLMLAPGDGHPFNDNHPVVDHFNGRTYSFTFVDEQGCRYIYTYPYELLKPAQAADYASDMGYDLLTLRYDADFDVEVAPGISWVPARILGGSDYMNSEIHSMLSASPEEKRNNIDTLYEALQLYQVGGFYASDDNIRAPENGIAWEHHKPGFDAVRTNNGCCATSANWLNYILADDYDEVGYIATSQRDGSGHIFNYIKEDGYYYIIDLTHYRTDWVATSVETGAMDDYFATDRIAGNIHRTNDLRNYVDYVQNEYGDPPGLMFAYMAENCLAIDSLHQNGIVTIIYEAAEGVALDVIFDDTSDSINWEHRTPPTNLPDWSGIPDHQFPAA